MSNWPPAAIASRADAAVAAAVTVTSTTTPMTTKRRIADTDQGMVIDHQDVHRNSEGWSTRPERSRLLTENARLRSMYLPFPFESRHNTLIWKTTRAECPKNAWPPPSSMNADNNEAPEVHGSAPPLPDAPSLAVQCVRALMERHGLPKYRQSAWLADATGSFVFAGPSPHDRHFDVVARRHREVAELFGESLADVVSSTAPRTSVPGTMRIGTRDLPVQLWIGEAIDKPTPNRSSPCRRRQAGQRSWRAEATEGVVYRIERLEARPTLAARQRRRRARRRPATSPTPICAHFEASGYDARPFFTIAELQSSIEMRRYDAFVNRLDHRRDERTEADRCDPLEGRRRRRSSC